MAGYGSYGYCSGHSRWFWGLRLHLVTTPAGLPVPYALTSATTNERDTVLAMFHLDADVINRPGQTLKADKGYRSAAFEAELNAARITLIRLALKSETIRPGQRFLRPFRQIIESVNQTLKVQTSASNATAYNASSPSPPPSGTTKQPWTARPITHRLRPLKAWSQSGLSL